MRGVIQGCGSPVCVSRTEMALLTHVMLTASQVVMADSKITNVEAKKHNHFDGE